MATTTTMTTASTSNTTPDLLSEWTDDQESALLKAVVRYKPVGMHKHFRMLAIRNSMLESGTVHPQDRHTSISGIWQKLNSLYDLPKLDEREDSVVNDTTADDDDDDDDDDENDGDADQKLPGLKGEEDGDQEGSSGKSDHWRDFELPRDDYEALMWGRRLKTEGSESPDWSRRGSTVADTDEPRSSPVSTTGRGSIRGSRSGATGGGAGGSNKKPTGGRLSRLQIELGSERSSRRASKTGSVPDEDQVMEDADEAGDEGDDTVQDSVEGGEDESESGEEEEKKTSGRKGTRGGSTPVVSGRKSRGRRGRRRN